MEIDDRFVKAAAIYSILFILVTITFWLGGTDFTQRNDTLATWFLLSNAVGGGASAVYLGVVFGHL